MPDTPEDTNDEQGGGQPLDGEAITPADDAKKGKGKKPDNRQYTRTSGQNEKQREEEEENSEPFQRAIMAGGLDWRHPGWEPSDKERRMVQILKFAGSTDEDIGRILDMSVETLKKHFDFELEVGRQVVIGDLASRAITRARQGDATLTMFLLKTRGGQNFSERAIQAQALGEALGKDEIDTTKRAELVGKILDVLDTHKRKTTAKKTDNKGDAT